MNVNYKQVGARIRDRRKLMGYTQEAIAEIVDLSASFVSHIECGRKKASLDTLVRISAALSVTVDWLLSGTSAIGTSAFLPEIQKLMDDCLPYERRIIVDVAEATKISLRNNRQAA